MNTHIVFYSATGNTESMANYILGVLEDKGHTVSIDFVADTDADTVAQADLIVLGSPAMSNEDVEDYEFRPFFDDLKPQLEGKNVILFGSYDWGDGEWMINWSEETEKTGANILAKFTAYLEPEEEDFNVMLETLNDLFQ